MPLVSTILDFNRRYLLSYQGSNGGRIALEHVVRHSLASKLLGQEHRSGRRGGGGREKTDSCEN